MMKNIEQPLWKRVAVPFTVYLISQSASLIILIPLLQGRTDEIMANIHITGTLAQVLMDLPAVVMFVTKTSCFSVFSPSQSFE